MRAAFWLAARELSARKRRAAVALAVVAGAAALVAATALLAHAREDAIARDLDAVGPSIVIVPGSAPPNALARQDLGGGLLPDGTVEAARSALGRLSRKLEARRVHRDGVDGQLVIGVQPGGAELAGVGPGMAAVGAELAAGAPAGTALRAAGRTFRVVASLPHRASAEDLAVFVGLGELDAALGVRGVNEVRVHLAPGADVLEAERRLAAAVAGRVLRIDRGEVAEREVQASLARHRLALYLFVAGVGALVLLVSAQLDAAERRTELATLLAVGAAPSTLLGTVVIRSVLVATSGALFGSAAGAALAVLQDPAAAMTVARAVPALFAVVAGAAIVGAVAAAPVALACARRDPVADLQDGSA